MTKELQELQSTMEHGFNIISELSKLSDKDLKIKIKDIIDKEYHECIDESNNIERTIVNEKPTKIKIYNWSSLIIEWTGISYKPEHGIPTTIRKFDKYFTLI